MWRDKVEVLGVFRGALHRELQGGVYQRVFRKHHFAHDFVPEVDGVTGAVKEQAKNAVIFETCALLGVSILVSTYATQLFTDILGRGRR